MQFTAVHKGKTGIPRQSGLVLLQVEGLLGMSADDLAMLKEGSPEKQQQYQALLKKVQWQDFVVRLQTRTRSESYDSNSSCHWLAENGPLTSLNPNKISSCSVQLELALFHVKSAEVHYALNDLRTFSALHSIPAGPPCCLLACSAHPMLCYAMLCYSMLCYAVLCCAVLCCAVLCCGTLQRERCC